MLSLNRMYRLPLVVILAGFSMTATIEARANRTRSEEIRHQILLSPYYGVYDWIEAEQPTRVSVILRGSVREPYAKSDIANRIRKIEGISTVVNEIKVLPLLPNDDRIRLATYRAIFRYNGPLFRYAHAVNPSIHIVVDNGRVTLKGVVADRGDRQLAYFAARNVSGVFEVNNDLRIEKN